MLLAETTTTSSLPLTHLAGASANTVLGLTVGLVLFAGVVVAGGRALLQGGAKSDPPGSSSPGANAPASDRTIVRSWLALALVGGLLLFCAASFEIDDTTLRSTLLGGLVASSSAAVAFYFASKSADQARTDILNASLPTTTVPFFMGKTISEVNALAATMPLHLVPTPPSPDSAWIVTSQKPQPNQAAPTGSSVEVTFVAPVAAIPVT